MKLLSEILAKARSYRVAQYYPFIVLIKNISIVEAIWSNLFVMILVGRLLGLPPQENK